MFILVMAVPLNTFVPIVSKFELSEIFTLANTAQFWNTLLPISVTLSGTSKLLMFVPIKAISPIFVMPFPISIVSILLQPFKKLLEIFFTPSPSFTVLIVFFLSLRLQFIVPAPSSNVSNGAAAGQFAPQDEKVSPKSTKLSSPSIFTDFKDGQLINTPCPIDFTLPISTDSNFSQPPKASSPMLSN